MPKAGSTTLQQGVFRKIDNFAYLCRPYANQKIQKVFDSIIMDSDLDFEEQLRKSKLIVLDFAKDNDMLISNEALTNSSLYGEGVSSRKVFDRLALVFGSLGDIKIVFVTRDRLAIIPSYYAQFEKKITFKEYVDRGLKFDYSIFKNLYYGRIMAELHLVFQAHNVICLKFEDLKSNKGLFAKSLSEGVQIPCPVVEEGLSLHLNRKSTNDGGHTAKFTLYDAILRLKLSLGLKSFGLRRFKFFKQVVKYLNSASFKSYSVKLNSQQKAAILDKYQQDEN